MCIRRCVGCVDLARYPWIDFDWPTPASRDESRPSLAAILAQLRDTAHARVTAVLRVGGAGLFAMAGGPWLAWLPIELLGRLPGRLVRPLPVDIGRYRYSNREQYRVMRQSTPAGDRRLNPGGYDTMTGALSLGAWLCGEAFKSNGLEGVLDPSVGF